ncbi:uncharacterized protein LOC117171997 [Belonocnema kinseyi]|uniref:uncharacterized protein LOC117171997 n=1 Tax=Belonocnema kinseyi TaxID=2817044 RepID=UPI00143D63B4|nr:uncharacterized protein LOC117171997 [Belonocnema kinseyi]
MSPILRALLLLFMFYFNEIETTDLEKKRKIDDPSSSKEGEVKIALDSTDKPKQKTYRFGRSPAQFQHNIDRTGNNAYSLFLGHYSRRPLPPPEVGGEAYLLFEEMVNHRPESSRTNSKGISKNVNRHSNPGSSNQQPHTLRAIKTENSDHVYETHEIPVREVSSKHQDLQRHHSNIKNSSGSEAVNRNNLKPGNPNEDQTGGSGEAIESKRFV